MKKFYVFLLSMFLVFPLMGAKRSTLPEIMNPRMIAVDDDKQLYVSDQHKIFVYSIDSLELLRTIGKKGEGPREFLHKISIQLLDDKVFLYTVNKFAVFKKNGEMLMEKMLSAPVLKINAVGDGFVMAKWGIVENRSHTHSIVLTDQHLRETGRLHEMKDERSASRIKSEIPFVTPLITFQCCSDKIVIADSRKGFFLEVFNLKGSLLWKIEKTYPRIPITKADKQRIINDFKNNAFVKTRWERLEKYFRDAENMFPDYFPAMKDLFVSRDRIYVKTHKTQNQKEEYRVLDLKGNLIGEIFLPAVKASLSSFQNDTFYYLEENETQEEWELHFIKINFASPKIP